MISRRFKSLTGQENISLPTANGTAGGFSGGELEQLKQEILTEVRQEVQKAKAEIIEGQCPGLAGYRVVRGIYREIDIFIL